jgi:hypothetical protein
VGVSAGISGIGNSIVSLIIGEIDDGKLLGTKPIDVASLMVKSALLQHQKVAATLRG